MSVPSKSSVIKFTDGECVMKFDSNSLSLFNQMKSIDLK